MQALGSAHEGERLIDRDVRDGDVVVLHDPFAASLAPAARARGAHVVWSQAIGPRRRPSVDAWRFLSHWRGDLDAYVTGWRLPGASARREVGLAAYIFAPDAISAKLPDHDPDRRYQHLGWASVLADIVSTDRDERVGGRLHPRPAVAVR